MRYRTQSPSEELVVAGLFEPVGLDWLHDYFEFLATDVAEAQQRTLEMIRYLVEQGLFVVGTPVGAGYAQWLMPLDEIIGEITSTYVDHFVDRDRWADTIALFLTAKGDALGCKLDGWGPAQRD